jgi:hypothetical protein
LPPLEMAYIGESPPWSRLRWVLMAPPLKQGRYDEQDAEGGSGGDRLISAL